jgi:hypothetical protein
VDSGACQVLHMHTGEVFGAAFHPDGTRLATATELSASSRSATQRGPAFDFPVLLLPSTRNSYGAGADRAA